MRRVRRFPLIAQVVAGFVALAWLAVTADAQTDVQDVTLKLSGQSCEANIVNVESALLHLRGVTMVDIEAKKGHVVVGFCALLISHRLYDLRDGNLRGIEAHDHVAKKGHVVVGFDAS